MTVRELIAALSEMDLDSDVYYDDDQIALLHVTAVEYDEEGDVILKEAGYHA